MKEIQCQTKLIDQKLENTFELNGQSSLQKTANPQNNKDCQLSSQESLLECEAGDGDSHLGVQSDSGDEVMEEEPPN